jgi:hypothetical protein
MSPRRLAVALVIAASLSAHGGVRGVRADPPKPPPYRVIVNPKNPNGSAPRKFVEEAFLKKTTSWPNGDMIRPVDQSVGAPPRKPFSDEVLHKSVAEVKSYWQQAIFAGRDVPPPELASDDDVIKFVLKHDGAIGYVSGTANLDGAKVIAVQ